jgi:CBS domain containing-hemolysin-like protein
LINKIVFIIFKLKPASEKPLSKQEILDLLISEVKEIDELKKKIMANILIFSERRISEIVVPLSDVIAVSDDKKVMDIVSIFKETGYSRIPIYRKKNRPNNWICKVV